MSRRDTIIIALLVNAGLLTLLFMLAINTDEDHVTDQPEIAKSIMENQIIKPLQEIFPDPVIIAESNSSDEVDNFLKELTTEQLTHPLLVDEEGYVELEKAPPVTPKQPIAKSSVISESNVLNDMHVVEVIVKRGDALEKIARNNGTTIEAIKKANNLSSTKLSVGQVLKVPTSKKNVTEITSSTKPIKQVAIVNQKETEKKAAITAAEIQYYTIKNGDNPWKIAKQYNVKFDDLLKLNGLDEERARNLKVGDKIRIR